MDFSEYQAHRLALIERCDRIERLWSDASRRTEAEEIHRSGSVDPDVVVHMIDEARDRLASTTVEIGVFGLVKRGKSTLVNALVGQEVSTMNVNPETAVPVWIQNGPSVSRVMFLDGRVEEMTLDEARSHASQKRRRKAETDKALRIEHTLRVPWLPEGVRIVDTPGLSDPSLSDEYEQLTLAELDRVSATIIVLVSPPGPESEEVSLVRSLCEKAVDKVFLVCNFHPDRWKNPSSVASSVEEIETIVSHAVGDSFVPADAKVYAVSARDGWRATESGDTDAFKGSGVQHLRKDLESFVSSDAVRRMRGFVEMRLNQALNITSDLLRERRRVLLSPDLAGNARRNLEQAIETSRSRLSELLMEVQAIGTGLAPELIRMMSEPFAEARRSVEGAKKVSDLENIYQRLRLQIETASSRASLLIDQRTGVEQAKLQRRLYETFGIEDRLRVAADTAVLSTLADVAPALPDAKTDKDAVAMGGLVGAASLGAIGSAISGGAGMALIALGPVGLIAGLGIGLLMGAFGGGILTRVLTRGSIDAQDRDEAVRTLRNNEATVRETFTRTVSQWTVDVQRELETMRSRYFDEQENELRHIMRVVGDSVAREAELERITSLVDRVKEEAG
ncbi:MAG: dynamin family protein [Acidimicrobiales bacterium]